MAWSTREMAQLAGTTVRAVRHYHQVGLLEEPRRCANGYKQYGVTHLLRTLRIRRLTDLGFSLTQVAEMGDDDQFPHDALRHLDGELDRNLRRLQRIRAELGHMLADAAPTDLPATLAAAIRDVDLSEADRSVLVVMSRVLDPDLVMDLVGVLQSLPDDGAARAFEALDPGSDETTRQALAERLLPRALAVRSVLPGLLDALDDPRADPVARRTIDQAVEDLYNPAQVDVMRRVRRMRPAPRPAAREAVELDVRTPARCDGRAVVAGAVCRGTVTPGSARQPVEPAVAQA